ncbi:bifunctional UDP-N-acetylglucosamine diphosphorylase/glucosamine-1-phosphate N-acetyltransferase GlmU [Thiotrichales bacterium 19S11-10]|nr:bifunctional UDP-N-acetylglucosamine diphosphorylase/glucosamine-1-phosphate N-acetyltransferase GlmU [Thiotrichales bacterium 19S11-10]
MELSVLILAAGLGKRMQSSKPKVLQLLAKKPLIKHVLNTLKLIQINSIGVIYGHLGEQLKSELISDHVTWIEQINMQGTGDAVKSALPHIKDNDMILILSGDVPLISANTLSKLIETTSEKQLGMLTFDMDDPTGFGRVIRDSNNDVIKIVEEKDATDDQKKIKEINAGIYYLKGSYLNKWLPKLNNQNAQKEYYLTDIVEMAIADQVEVNTVRPEYKFEITGVNSRLELAKLERDWQSYQAKKLMQEGVTLLDPKRIDIRGDIKVGQDTVIDVNVILEGNVKIGKNCQISANCILKDVIIADNVVIKPNSMLEGVKVDSEVEIGPFARIRPDTYLSQGAKVGNFVEIKKSTIGNDSKINHLSYIGDTEVGDRVNIGAGVITCNYDGANKHQTIIEDDVFVGSDSQLVAPVKLGKGSFIGSGSTITKNTPEGKLTLNRSSRQITLDAWKRPKKNK